MHRAVRQTQLCTDACVISQAGSLLSGHRSQPPWDKRFYHASHRDVHDESCGGKYSLQYNRGIDHGHWTPNRRSVFICLFVLCTGNLDSSLNLTTACVWVPLGGPGQKVLQETKTCLKTCRQLSNFRSYTSGRAYSLSYGSLRLRLRAGWAAAMMGNA
jgi:hypothetical protein